MFAILGPVFAIFRHAWSPLVINIFFSNDLLRNKVLEIHKVTIIIILNFFQNYTEGGQVCMCFPKLLGSRELGCEHNLFLG